MNYDFSFEYEDNGYFENQYETSDFEESSLEEEIRRKIYETEEELDNWNVVSRNIKDMESTIAYDNTRALERIDTMREISSKGDAVLSQLWEMKANILSNINRNSNDFNEWFEEEDRNIRKDYEEKVSGLYEELRGY